MRIFIHAFKSCVSANLHTKLLTTIFSDYYLFFLSLIYLIGYDFSSFHFPIAIAKETSIRGPTGHQVVTSLLSDIVVKTTHTYEIIKMDILYDNLCP